MSPELGREYTETVILALERRRHQRVLHEWLLNHLQDLSSDEISGVSSTVAFLSEWRQGSFSARDLPHLRDIMAGTLSETTFTDARYPQVS